MKRKNKNLLDVKNRKVLLLEDEPVIGKIVSRTLAADGLGVDVAQNGQIAKEKINSSTFYDLFIFDIRTPIINGMQVYEYMEQEHPDKTQRVLFTTGDCLNTATRIFLERVNRPYLAKPYTPGEIKTLITNALNINLSSS
jgi:DNA-binding response OmpR family regulator